MNKKSYIKPIISETIILLQSGMMEGSFKQGTGDTPVFDDDEEGASISKRTWDDDPDDDYWEEGDD